MNNSQIYPFERNRYYPGKMLTSADFEAEQSYYINRERFLSSLMYGSGVVCGLGVFSLDDLSLLVESGVAFDGNGREIIIDSSVVKKLSAIEGFDSLKTDNACLCLRYKEEQIASVYAAGKAEGDREYEYNRISEKYELFLNDSSDIPPEIELETEFLVTNRFMKSDHYLVEVALPATVSRGRNVRVSLIIKKLSDYDVRLSLDGILETPAFLSEKGEKQLDLSVTDVTLKKGEVITRDFWAKVENTDSDETNIILRSGSAHGYENDASVPVEKSFAVKIKISNRTPLELVSTEIGRMSLEMRAAGARMDFVPLAEIKLERTDNAYIIEKVTESGVKHYITAPGQEFLRNSYLEYFNKSVDFVRERTTSLPESTREFSHSSSSDGKEPSFATETSTGVLEIPLGVNASEGDIRFSGEITHGLGKGNVYVSVGYESIEKDDALMASARNTIYGNPALFVGQGGAQVDAETAVRVMNDKGSFVVAARLLHDVDYLTLTYRWVAMKFPAGAEMESMEDYFDKSISAETPTVVMGIKESHFFGVVFHNMPKSSISYELTSQGAGEINANGVYTAPAKEGVYEIRIYCTDMPVICTYAYAIVKKDLVNEDGES
ncbi:MAG: hypothetical protein II745_03570 [Lachnospiraceae bacterium]|nr:hypothetical protein [Lachnospiraceae bacterium]